MLQELQEGWITYEEFNAFQDYVLNYAKDNYNYSQDDYSQTDWFDNDPIGAFYDSQSVQYDHAQSIAQYTGVLVSSNNQALSVAQLQALDTNNDGQLTVTESASLRYWQDSNEDGHLDAGELLSINHSIRQADYVFYVAGNAQIATSQPNESTYTSEPAVPDSNYRTLRDTDNTYIAQLLGDYIVWTPDQIKTNYNNRNYLIGTDGADSFNANYYADNEYFNIDLFTHFLAGDGDDVMGGSNRDDHLWGGTGNDELHGYAGNDHLYGEAGNDVILGQVGNDTIYGGLGNDSITGFTASEDTKQTLDAGESDNDTIYGGAGDDTIYGAFGDDIIDGGADNDLLLGNEGDDKVWGGTGNDELQVNDGNEELMGGEREDRLVEQTGNDKLWGGSGNDLMVGFSANNEEKQSLEIGETDDDYLNGGSGEDILKGRLGNDRLYGGTENDELQGNEGDDKLYGEAGNDHLFGQVGDDILYGGDGDDILYGFTASNEDKQSLDTGESDNDYLYGGSGQDILFGDLGNDYLDGGADADSMVGGLGDDTYIVNSVNDSIYEKSNEGYDTVISSTSYLLNANIEQLRLLEGFNIHGTGNAQDNKIIGNSSDNILDGVTGADQMIGGLGDDTYYVDNIGDKVVENNNE
ncbi:Alkaline phosphatase (EC, partial [Bathymodiolus thermophilus thioautotrophic gill symbiont]